MSFTAVRSTKIAFAYTVKTLGPSTVTSNDYVPFFRRLEALGVEVEYKIDELDSKGKLHYHGIIYLKKGFYRKRVSLKGFHVKLEELYNKAGWLKYIHKDVPPEQWPDDYSDEYIEDQEQMEMPKKRLF